MQPAESTGAEGVEQRLVDQLRGQHVRQQIQMVKHRVADLQQEIRRFSQLRANQRQNHSEQRRVQDLIELGEQVVKAQLEAFHRVRQREVLR